MNKVPRFAFVGLFFLGVLAPSPAQDAETAALAGKARKVLETHCYRCHGQNGTNEGGFNYALDRDRLIERRKVITGDASKSKLVKRMVSEDDPMPPADQKSRPSKDDVEAIRAWVTAGAPAFTAPAKERVFLTHDDVLGVLKTDLEKANERDRPYLRYFTLTHLHNAGLSEDELQSYRNGLSKLVNSLSWGRDIVPPTPIDPAKTVLRIDLRRYRWRALTWDRVAEANPYGVSLPSKTAKEISELTGAEQPAVRADWFVHAASRPPLYHAVLDLPATDRALEDRLEVNVAENIKEDQVARAGFNGSGVSRNNRLVERHQSGYGAYWKSYDFAGNAGRKNLFERPLGPDREEGFEHDGGEIVFNLPNGLQGYMLVDGKGSRIDKGPQTVVSDPKQPDRAVVNGISCMSCHSKGVIEKTDQVREHVLKNQNAFTKEEVGTVKALYPEKDRFADLLKEDAERFRRAVNRTLGKPRDRLDEKLPETEPITALALLFEQELDARLAATEVGAPLADFMKAVDTSANLKRSLGPLRVQGGTVQRQAFVDAFPDLLTALHTGTTASTAELPTVELANSIGIRFVRVKAGRFRMGSAEKDAEADEKPPREVEITRGFYLGICEVTQGEYLAVVGKNPAEHQPGKGAVNHPVEQISWDDAQGFCEKLSALPKEKAAGRTYRLPTEAEWEYACRAGTRTPFGFEEGGEKLKGFAWFKDNAEGNTHPVGGKSANAWGLLDLHGNVREWCQDWYADYDPRDVRDPAGPGEGAKRVVRGGSFNNSANYCRSAVRSSLAPDRAEPDVGFRVVCVVAK